jgi:hypothetical protein
MGKKKETAPALVDHVVTEDTLELNPELVEQGVKVGDTVQYLAKPDAAQSNDDIIAELKAENAALKTQLTHAAEKYTTTISDLDDEVVMLSVQLKEAHEIAQDALNGYNTAAAQVANNNETEVDGQKVKVNFGVHHDGIDYSAADLVDNPEVVSHLIAIGSGSITLLEN